jgi:hypothetical protein
MTCDSCGKEGALTVDIWAQGCSHNKNDELLSKTFELDTLECAGVDYITLCFDCWYGKFQRLWKDFVGNLPVK